MSGFGHCDELQVIVVPDAAGVVIVLGDGFAHAHLDFEGCAELVEALLAAAAVLEAPAEPRRAVHEPRRARRGKARRRR